MKKAVKIFFLTILSLFLLAIVFVFVLARKMEKAGAKLEAVAVTELSDVEDGTYEGSAETPLVLVRVKVTVKDHKIEGINLIEHRNGKGQPAEAMIQEMLDENTSEVDSVAGATMSSTAIRAAVRDALLKGISVTKK